jgi:SAM-dependent methyltransferase
MLRATGLITAARYAEHKAGAFSDLVYMDITKPLPLRNESVSAVFSSHVLEHLFADEVHSLASELKRVMIPGGICRVVVPDLEKIVASYNVDRPQAFIDAIFEARDRAEISNAHHMGFTYSSLKTIFLNAGFAEATRESYREGSCPDVQLLDNRPQSLFFEARR